MTKSESKQQCTAERSGSIALTVVFPLLCSPLVPSILLTWVHWRAQLIIYGMH